MHRRHAVPRKKGWAFGEEDRETLLLPPMCSAVPVRDVMCVKPTRPSPRMPAAPGAGRGQDDAWWAHSAGEWGHGNMSTRGRQQSWPRILPSQSSRLCISGVRILRLRGASTKRRPVPALCAVPACFRHVWRLLSARGSGTWRRALSLIITRSDNLGLVPATWRHSYSKVLIIRLSE